MRSESDIIATVDGLVRYYADREAVLKRAEDMYLLLWLQDQEAQAQGGYDVYVDPSPFDTINMCVGLVGSAERTISVLPKKATRAMFLRSDEWEEYLRAADYWIDDNSDMPLATALAYSQFLRGKAATRMLYVSDADPSLQVQPRDYRFVFPMIRNGRCVQVVEQYMRSVKDIISAYPDYAKYIPEGGELNSQVKWAEYWDDEVRCYLIDGKVALKPTRHELGTCPYYVAGGGATFLKGGATEALPFIYGAYYPWRQANRAVTLASRLAAAGAGETAWQKLGLWDRFVGIEPGDINESEDTNARLIPVINKDVPPGLGSIIALSKEAMGRTLVSGVMAGDSRGPVVAGYAIDLLIREKKLRFQPYAEATERIYTWMFRRLVAMCRLLGADKVLGALQLESEWGEGDDKKRYIKQFNFAREDLSDADDMVIRVKVKISGQSNAAQDAQIGAIAIDKGVASRQTAAERWFGVTDAASEQQLIETERIRNSDEYGLTLAKRTAREIDDEIDAILAKEEEEAKAKEAEQQAIMQQGMGQPPTPPGGAAPLQLPPMQPQQPMPEDLAMMGMGQGMPPIPRGMM